MHLLTEFDKIILNEHGKGGNSGRHVKMQTLWKYSIYLHYGGEQQGRTSRSDLRYMRETTKHSRCLSHIIDIFYRKYSC